MDTVPQGDLRSHSLTSRLRAPTVHSTPQPLPQQRTILLLLPQQEVRDPPKYVKRTTSPTVRFTQFDTNIKWHDYVTPKTQRREVCRSCLHRCSECAMITAVNSALFSRTPPTERVTPNVLPTLRTSNLHRFSLLFRMRASNGIDSERRQRQHFRKPKRPHHYDGR